MNPTPATFAVLAVSSLSAGSPIRSVSAMFAFARQLARSEGVTGTMVFDGGGFCQYLEGSRDAVLRCLERSRADSRQAECATVYHGPFSGARRYRHFVSGYAVADGLPASEQLRTLDGDIALQKFLALSRDFDLGV